MPTYEYACTACGERTEARQGFDDPPLQVCPVCGGKLRKLYSPVGIVFKGTGFYSTDGKKAPKGAGETTKGEKSDKASEKASEKSPAPTKSKGKSSTTTESSS